MTPNNAGITTNITETDEVGTPIATYVYSESVDVDADAAAGRDEAGNNKRKRRNKVMGKGMTGMTGMTGMKGRKGRVDVVVSFSCVRFSFPFGIDFAFL